MPSSSPEQPRRQFIRGLAAGSVALASAASLPATLARSNEKGSSSFNLDDLRRWADAGANWTDLRAQFLLDPQIVYLNTGSLGASPRVVVDAHSDYLRDIERNPAHLVFGETGNEMEAMRKLAADFLGADLDEMMLTANTTSGMNLIAAALPLQAGDEVLTTDEEHAGGSVCWQHERKTRGITIRKVHLRAASVSAATLVDAFAAALSERTKVISLSHVSTISGLRLPVAAISQMARERGIFMVIDGAQSAGMLEINLHEIGCDAFATSGHKWLLAPKGSGLLYLRKALQPHLSSVYLNSGLRAYSAASGTRNVPQILAQGTALNFLDTIGRRRIEQRALALSRRLRRQLSTLPGVEVISPADPELQSAIVTFQLPTDATSKAKAAAWKGSSVSRKLWEQHRIVVKPVPGEPLQGRGIRISTHFYNTERDIEYLINALREIMTGLTN